jgi:hypothetical protein
VTGLLRSAVSFLTVPNISKSKRNKYLLKNPADAAFEKAARMNDTEEIALPQEIDSLHELSGGGCNAHKDKENEHLLFFRAYNQLTTSTDAAYNEKVIETSALHDSDSDEENEQSHEEERLAELAARDAHAAELPSVDFMAQYGGSPETYIERASTQRPRGQHA